jgi:predicted ArsR family transcriptional regulator
VKTLTTAEAAQRLGVAVGTFRRKAKSADVRASLQRATGKRGRPAFLWTLNQIKQLK